MTPASRNKKKQTRIQFEALSRPSPASENYSPSVKGRLANVRYSGKRPKVTEAHGGLFGHLPTPEPSSASRPEIAAHFNLPNSKDIMSEESSPLSIPPTSPALSTTPLNSTIPQKDASPSQDAGEDEDDVLLPVPKRRKLVGPGSATATIKPTRRSARLTQSSPLRGRRSITHNNASSNSKPLHPTSPLRVLSDIGSAETSDDEADVVAFKPLAKRTRYSKHHKDDDFDAEHHHIDNASDREPRKTTLPRRMPRNDIDDFLVGDDEVEFITSEDEPTTTSTKRRKSRNSQKISREKAKRVQEELAEDLLDLQDSDQEDDETRSRTRGGPVTTQRDQAKEHFARLKQQRAGKRQPRVIISDDSDSDSPENLTVSDDDEYEEDDGIDIDNVARSPEHVDLVSQGSSAHALIGAPEVLADHYHGSDNDNDDFIVEDVETTTSYRHNRPHPDIPLQFTSFASAKPKELFVHIVEWMVKNKLSPAFARDDDIYDLSFSRIDDQVKAQAGSRLISAAWNTTFKQAILARPIMTVEALPGLDEDHLRTCDACNRTNHPARYDFKFSGTPYNKDNLEPIDIDDSGSDDEGDENEVVKSGIDNVNEDEGEDNTEDEDTRSKHSTRPSYDSQGHLLVSSETHFYLGRYCAASAEMGHKLTHWKHHLNTDVLSYLEDQQVLSANAIVNRDKRPHKKREREAENIVDAMQETGVIKELWERFQADLDDARWGMEGHEAKDKRRSKARIGSVRVRGQDGRIGEWMEGGKYKHLGVVDSDDSDAHD